MQKIWFRYGAVLAVSVALSGCFDLTQKVSIDRDGSGHYDVAISAQGIVGQALRNKSPNLAGQNRASTTTTDVNGIVTQRSEVKFKSLSDLAFSDQVISLTSRGNALFGLGPAEMTFRRSFLIDRARREHEGDSPQSAGLGMQIAQSLLGNHIYVFSVTLPGSIERIAPIEIAGQKVQPEVTGDFLEHTVTWRMPLYMMVEAHALNFEVDFSAYGWFTSAHTRKG